MTWRTSLLLACGCWLLQPGTDVHLLAQVAIQGEKVYTMAGPPLEDGVVLIRGGKIVAIGNATEIQVPDEFETLSAKVVTPGIIDAHSTVGFSGILNIDHDQDQLEHNAPLQPELRTIDAYNSHDDLIAWVRSYGVTTVHTGHAPGELISGQTLITKTSGETANAALLNPACAVAVTLTSPARKSGDKSPGTRGKMISMLRAALIKAQEYAQKRDDYQAKIDGAAGADHQAEEDSEVTPPERDLRSESLADVLAGKMKLMITADRAQDIASALRLAREFEIQIWLDSAAESYMLLAEIKAAGVSVLVHPTMARSVGERENLSFETAAKLVAAGIPTALQSGYESYVPKTRVVLLEAAYAAAHGLTFEQALGTITIEAARILGIDARVGSLEIGKDGDVALYDGDPFEYTTHCLGVVIDGLVVSREKK